MNTILTISPVSSSACFMGLLFHPFTSPGGDSLSLHLMLGNRVEKVQDFYLDHVSVSLVAYLQRGCSEQTSVDTSLFFSK